MDENNYNMFVEKTPRVIVSIVTNSVYKPTSNKLVVMTTSRTIEKGHVAHKHFHIPITCLQDTHMTS